MKEGDLVFYYHSNIGKEIVGIAMVIKKYYQDPTTEDTYWVVVDLEVREASNNPVTLETVKLTAKLQNMQLVKNPRLSVQKVTPEEYKKITEIAL